MSKKINIEELKRDKPIYEVPEGYFENLTSRIQDRIKEEEEVSYGKAWVPRLAWATPVLILVIGFIYFFNVTPEQSAEEMLAEISTEELVAYLELTDISTDEILASMDQEFLEDAFSDVEGDADILNDISEEDLDGILDSYDLNEDFL